MLRVAIIWAVCLVTTTAHAQNNEPASGPAIQWEGFYIGGHAGLGTTEFDSVFDTGEIVFGPLDVLDNVLGRFFDLDGGMGGVQFGFNRSEGRYVYGVEADWSYLGYSDRRFDPDFEPEGTDNASVDINWLASVRGRLGVTSAHTLFFATAGVAWVDAEYTAQNGDEFNVNQGTASLNDTGVVVGGGIEHALSNRYRVRLEGLYYHFGDRVDTSTLNTDSDPGDFAELKSILIGRLGVSYALGAASGTGQAARNAPMPVNWEGFYAGGALGYGVVDFDSIYDSSEIFTPINTEDSVIGDFFDLDGVVGSVHVGVNRQRDRMVFGVEADWTYLNRSDLEFDPDGGSPGGDDSASVELDWLASLRGRLGITSARTLLYATAGLAWVNGEYTALNGNIGNVNQGSTDVNSTGFVYGGGIEHALADNILVRFEALRYEFNDHKDTSTLSTDSDPGDFAGVDDITIMRIGLTRRFGTRAN